MPQTPSSQAQPLRPGLRRQLSAVEVAQTRGRERPLTNFGTVLRRGAAGGLQAVQAHTAGYLPPAGAVVSAALSGAGTLADVQGGGAALPVAAGGAAGGVTGALGGSVAAGGGAPGAVDQREILAATDRMQKENQMFNLRFVQIQESFARDGRTYTAISNLMKAKNDTARNTLGNLR